VPVTNDGCWNEKWHPYLNVLHWRHIRDY
jgi:hypothetical protein